MYVAGADVEESNDKPFGWGVLRWSATTQRPNTHMSCRCFWVSTIAPHRPGLVRHARAPSASLCSCSAHRGLSRSAISKEHKKGRVYKQITASADPLAPLSPETFVYLVTPPDLLRVLASLCLSKMDAAVVGRLTPFMLFYTEHRDAVKARINTANKAASSSSSFKPQDISKEICRLWQRLSPREIKDYCLLSNLYAESLAKHGGGRKRAPSIGGGSESRQNKTVNSSKKRNKDSRLPKPPVNSFMCFSRHHRAALRSQNRELNFCEIGKAVGVLWKSAGAAQKRPFDEMAAKVGCCCCLAIGILILMLVIR